MDNFSFSDFGSLASIISLAIGLIGGFFSCKSFNKSNIQNSSLKNITAGGDVIGRDKK